jgi:AcrR family transcriptional regulator
VGRSLRTAASVSVDRGKNLNQAAATVLARGDGQDITVQDVADEAGQSLRTLYHYFEGKDDLLALAVSQGRPARDQVVSVTPIHLDI